MPQRVDYDGYDRKTDELCYTNDLFNKDVQDCVPMTRIYYLEYQWMPVYMASLALIYYLPYVLFRYALIYYLPYVLFRCVLIYYLPYVLFRYGLIYYLPYVLFSYGLF